MKIIVGVLIGSLLCLTAAAQRSVRELQPAHAAALEKYLTANKDRTFRQEHILSREYLKTVRNDWGFGKSFKPNYAVADLNGDRLTDFAVLLYRKGEPIRHDSEGMSEEHSVDYPLTLVVFNGVKGGGFRVAFERDLEGPPAAFINIASEKGKKTLYYGVFETDADTFMLAPAGKGYIMEFEEPR